jgi:ATP phosphoribosyltransferase regulatory subunit HisZ
LIPHLQVQRVQPREIQARHILIMPEIGQAEGQRLGARDPLAQALHDGAAYDSLARLYHDPAEARGQRCALGQLPDEYKAESATDSGTAVAPFAIRKEMGLRRKYVVLEVTGRRTEGAIDYVDVKEQIRKRMSDDLGVRHYLDRLRRATYVDVRM